MSAQVGMAVQAFEEVERVQLLLERKRKALSDAMRVVNFSPEERLDYFYQTEEIRQKYDEKREKAKV